MNAAGLTYGEAEQVAEWLLSADMDNIRHEDLVAALGNALNRIAALEARLARAEHAARARK